MARAYSKRDRDLLELYRGLNLALDLHAQWWLPGWVRDACWSASRKYEEQIHAWLCAGVGCDADARRVCPFECCARVGRVQHHTKKFGESFFKPGDLNQKGVEAFFDRMAMYESLGETMERLGMKVEPGTPKELTGADYRALMEKAGLGRPVEFVDMPPATPETFRAGKEHLERIGDAYWRRVAEQMYGTLRRCQDGGFAKAVAAETKSPPAIVVEMVEVMLVSWKKEIATLLTPR